MCAVCSQSSDEVGLLCDWCGAGFHANCAGYELPVLQPCPVEVFCASCLEDDDLTPDDVLWRQWRELVKIWLESPASRFRLVVVKGDGTCMLGAVWKWLQLDANRLKRSGFKSRRTLIRRVAETALVVIRERAERDEVPAAELQECEAVWTSIERDPDELAQLWNGAALDYAWLALARLFPWARVDVWELRPGAREPVCNSKFGAGNDVLSVIRCSIGAAHYDLLAPAK